MLYQYWDLSEDTLRHMVILTVPKCYVTIAVAYMRHSKADHISESKGTFQMRKIKELRQRKGLSLRQLEERSGVDHSSIGRIEKGDFVPNLKTLLKLARALEVDPRELIEIEEE